MTNASMARSSKKARGTILVDTDSRGLYYVLPQGKGDPVWRDVGEEALAWSGIATIPKLSDSEGSCQMVVGLGGPGGRSLKRFGGGGKEEVAHEADVILAHQPWRMADSGNFHDTSFRAGSTHPPCRRG